MGPSLSPSSAAAAYEHRYPCSPDDDYYEDDDFEFTPLLPRPRRRRSTRTERPRTTVQAATAAPAPPQPAQQRARRGAPTNAAAVAAPASRKVRWHDMAFGSVRMPAAMDMGEIRRRLHARQHGAGDEPSSAAAAGWAPWRLIRSLSCKGVEAVAAAAAPVRLV
ncbi:hypothetical protein PAHAL_6G086800 [Panicum hallii]|jgi:hypothetical protein|uniref:Uncharacterized protein n=1 Tax=Panicum hallii TaxID=206008 RepID=A0A2S3I233_9POAL|nr:hypothetical protein PAHAL_6G086800 [Panicum hallii]